jgi:sterol 3beta-glucosyltransferase
LVRFLESGPPPVYFGVGSMRSERMAALLRTAAEAITATGQRGILAAPQGMAEHVPGDRFLAVEGIPHAWLFPRMRLVIHHGGAGTTGAALRGGVPSLATPVTADQAFWGRRISHLGVGPQPVPANRLTVSRLAALIDQMLQDRQMQERASAFGQALEDEDGTAGAVRLVSRVVDRNGAA